MRLHQKEVLCALSEPFHRAYTGTGSNCPPKIFTPQGEQTSSFLESETGESFSEAREEWRAAVVTTKRTLECGNEETLSKDHTRPIQKALTYPQYFGWIVNKATVIAFP